MYLWVTKQTYSILEISFKSLLTLTWFQAVLLVYLVCILKILSKVPYRYLLKVYHDLFYLTSISVIWTPLLNFYWVFPQQLPTASTLPLTLSPLPLPLPLASYSPLIVMALCYNRSIAAARSVNRLYTRRQREGSVEWEAGRREGGARAAECLSDWMLYAATHVAQKKTSQKLW